MRRRQRRHRDVPSWVVDLGYIAAGLVVVAVLFWVAMALVYSLART